MAYRLAPQAEADLEDIAFYIFLESGSLESAARLIQMSLLSGDTRLAQLRKRFNLR
jgi:hypothetical protein